MIRCVLADDHVLARELLCKAMEQTSTIRIVGDYGDAREAAEYAVDQKVDVLILAVNIPGSSPFEAARWAKASHFPLKTIFLTGSTEEEHVLNAVEAGASAYLMKTCGLEELQHTIIKVHQGEKHIAIKPRLVENVLFFSGTYQEERFGENGRLCSLASCFERTTSGML